MCNQVRQPVLASDDEDSKDINKIIPTVICVFIITLIIRTLCVFNDFAIRVIRGKIEGSRGRLSMVDIDVPCFGLGH